MTPVVWIVIGAFVITAAWIAWLSRTSVQRVGHPGRDLTRALQGVVAEMNTMHNNHGDAEPANEARVPRGPFLCVHCGQPCGITGHVRIGTVARPVCARTEPLSIVRDHQGREFGFCCPVGHECQFGTVAVVNRRRRGAWRHDPATERQIETLRSLGWAAYYEGGSPVLGMRNPVTKGEAHDLLARIFDGDLAAKLAEPRAADGRQRAIIVRDGDEYFTP